MSIVVVDTNVVLVANGQHADVSPECVADCATLLQEIMKRGQLAIDDGFEILIEYQNKTTPKKGNRPGDAFVKWVLRNRLNSKFVEQATLESHPTRVYESFPDDARLTLFDVADRKFVAVANVMVSKPEIMQAADSKWLGWSPILKQCGVSVTFLCQPDIVRFSSRKTKRN